MIAIVMSYFVFTFSFATYGNSHSSHMAAAAGGIIFCKVFGGGENILSFGGVCRHPIGDVTFGIIFCRGPNSAQGHRAGSAHRRQAGGSRRPQSRRCSARGGSRVWRHSEELCAASSAAPGSATESAEDTADRRQSSPTGHHR